MFLSNKQVSEYINCMSRLGIGLFFRFNAPLNDEALARHEKERQKENRKLFLTEVLRGQTSQELPVTPKENHVTDENNISSIQKFARHALFTQDLLPLIFQYIEPQIESRNPKRSRKK